MHQLDGIAVSPGLAIGEALIIDNEGFHYSHFLTSPDKADAEVERFQFTLDNVAADIERNQATIAEQVGDYCAAIFTAHLQMLRDKRLSSDVVQRIRERGHSAEYAVSRTLRDYAEVFRKIPNEYLASRAHDILDLERRLLQSLTGDGQDLLEGLDYPVVILAHDLTPSETARLNPKYVLGFGTEIGGAGGHAAIVAKGLEIPAVVGIGELLDKVSGGDQVIIDGDAGCLIIDPDEATLQHYRILQTQQRADALRLEELRDYPAETKDGQRIDLLANIEFPHETEACLHHGANGIGLYRTEFLYLAATGVPSEEDHYQAYADVATAMKGQPIVIRTLDLGADKATSEPTEPEPNPFLGLRSIRLALAKPELFKPQLRAILRASCLGDIRVMFPLISTLGELRRAKAVLREAMQELDDEGVDFNRSIPVGMMVESPAAAILIQHFMDEVDFISIGTNDLIQYTLAVDRGNPAVNDMYQAGDPAVLQLIKRSIDAANQAGVEVSLCGQMSSVAFYTILLIGMGLRKFSSAPSSIPIIKSVCRKVTVPQCEAIAEAALQLKLHSEVDSYLRTALENLGLAVREDEACKE